MSECVVRMEMPTSCEKCPACDYEEGNCLLADDRNTLPHNGKRRSWCPIICSLPEGHGRIGDLDELGRKINGARIRVMQDGKDTNPYWECGDIIASEQIIVPAERRENNADK